MTRAEFEKLAKRVAKLEHDTEYKPGLTLRELAKLLTDASKNLNPSVGIYYRDGKPCKGKPKDVK